MIPSSEIRRAPVLRLIVVESQSYVPETCFEINACGYLFSKRKADDGEVHIGTKGENTDTQEWTNDIVFSKGERGMGDKHFVIKYIADSKSYYVRDSGEGTGTFIQIDSSITLQNEYIISFAAFHIFLMITTHNELHLKFLDGPNDQL
eukprot:TRINITY_DN3495_c0_g1_i3.p1 TRINITY_DN3495_c0_g1~~TRINITY_DN3495_c0_g1_i3.p1  ORF type:complete len:148 (-),score=35.22 TRINITY_DN3495_c0_g1_i3:426-869(-)